MFTNIPLNETIELALDYILSNKTDVNISKKTLKNCFSLLRLKRIFILTEIFMNKSTE